MTRYIAAFILVLTLGWGWNSPVAQAGCVVESSPGSFSNGANLRDDRCDTAGNKKVTPSTLLSGENQGSGQSSSWIAVRPLVHATYAASNTFTPPATPTDLVTITGSASKTIRIVSFKLTTTNTAAGSQQFFLVKRSTADTGGTPVAGTVVTFDSGNAAGTATVNHYTANPGALGTAVGTVNTMRVKSEIAVPGVGWNIVDSGVELLPVTKVGGTFTTQPITLRGIAEQLVVNFNGAALVAGQTHAYSIVWTESVAPSE